MEQPESEFGQWEPFWQRLEALGLSLARSGAKNVNAASLRTQARDTVQFFFRHVKPALSQRGVTNNASEGLETDLKWLMGLASGKNSKASYRNAIRRAKGRRRDIETGLEFLIGAESPAGLAVSETENAILKTLRDMIPSAAASYNQALLDLHQKGRASYRGTAAELREVVREILDTLAPDGDVTAAPGFQLETGRRSPTMAQKVRFILRAREAPDPPRETAENSARIVDESVAKLGRSVYSRGAMNVHSARALEEIRNFKLYADALLGELLEIHKPREETAEQANKESAAGASRKLVY